MARFWIGLTVTSYIACSILTYGAVVARDQYECHHRWKSICDKRMVREDKAFAAVYAAIPPGWVAAAIFTGFWMDGVQFTGAIPHIADNL